LAEAMVKSPSEADISSTPVTENWYPAIDTSLAYTRSIVVSVALAKFKVTSPPGVVSPSSQVPSPSPSTPSSDVS